MASDDTTTSNGSSSSSNCSMLEWRYVIAGSLVKRDGAFEHSERDVNTDYGADAFATRLPGEISKAAPEIKDAHPLQ
jgi:hypothetical protein